MAGFSVLHQLLLQQCRGTQPQQGHAGCLGKSFVPGYGGLGFRDLEDALQKTNVKFVSLRAEPHKVRVH